MTHAETDWRYRMLVSAIIVFAAGYFCVAGLPELLGIAGGERYLAYHWLVFTYVPSREEISYEANVISGPSATGTSLIDPRFLVFDEWRNRPFYSQAIQQLGSALARGSDADIERERVAIEQFIVHKPLNYAVSEVQYNPIDRFLTGALVSRRTIGTFTAR